MKTQPLLRVEHLCQYFRSGGATLKAVDDVSFEIGKGEVFGLVGESGCGKTTTGRSIIRLYDITSGSVYFKGVRIAAGTDSYRNEVKRAKAEYKNAQKEAKGSENAEKRKAEAEEKYHAAIKEQTENIRSAVYDKKNFDKDYRAAREKAIAEEYEKLLDGVTEEEKRAALIKEKNEKIRLAKKSSIMNDIQMIFQDPIASLDPRMTVREIIAEGLVIRGIKDKKYIDEEVYRVLDLVGLRPEHAGRYPHEFSGGQRQRIGIARAIILNPELIIADEPISALDVSIQAQVINLLNDLRKRLSLTILFIAHDLSVVKYFSDRIGVMYFGKLVELATSDELFSHPLHPYTKSLLSAIPLPDPAYEKLRKRIVYNPLAEHDYGTDKPVMREVSPGHFVYCNEEEFNRYKKQLTEGE
ncbi:MAG: ATP-binding cassette domain-containing protein [Candidatus Borkfalkiaceae bacterium]|nr:ATP-binding cassette domain-containing protein [Christensenellaceae bacterium]